jgi:hypothetical protein
MNGSFRKPALSVFSVHISFIPLLLWTKVPSFAISSKLYYLWRVTFYFFCLSSTALHPFILMVKVFACQNGGTTGGTQVACNLGGIRGFAVIREDWKNQHHEHSYACALLSDSYDARLHVTISHIYSILF